MCVWMSGFGSPSATDSLWMFYLATQASSSHHWGCSQTTEFYRGDSRLSACPLPISFRQPLCHLLSVGAVHTWRWCFKGMGNLSKAFFKLSESLCMGRTQLALLGMSWLYCRKQMLAILHKCSLLKQMEKHELRSKCPSKHHASKKKQSSYIS